MVDWETVRMILEQVESNPKRFGRAGLTKLDIVSEVNSKGKLVSEDELRVLGCRFVRQLYDRDRLEVYATGLTSDGSRLLGFIRTPEMWSEIESRAKRADLHLTPDLALLIGRQVASERIE